MLKDSTLGSALIFILAFGAIFAALSYALAQFDSKTFTTGAQSALIAIMVARAVEARFISYRQRRAERKVRHCYE